MAALPIITPDLHVHPLAALSVFNVTGVDVRERPLAADLVISRGSNGDREKMDTVRATIRRSYSLF